MAEAGWLHDPTGRFDLRYFDGAEWTAHVSHSGVQAEDPLGSSASPPGYRASMEKPPQGLAVGSLVCGIVGCVFGLIPITSLIALAGGIVAIVLGIVARKRGLRGMATTGVVLGCIALALGVWGFIIVQSAVDDLNRDLNTRTYP